MRSPLERETTASLLITLTDLLPQSQRASKPILQGPPLCVQAARWELPAAGTRDVGALALRGTGPARRGLPQGHVHVSGGDVRGLEAGTCGSSVWGAWALQVTRGPTFGGCTHLGRALGLCHSLYNLEEAIFLLLICKIKGLISVSCPPLVQSDLEPCYSDLWSPGVSAALGAVRNSDLRPHLRPPESDSAS